MLVPVVVVVVVMVVVVVVMVVVAMIQMITRWLSCDCRIRDPPTAPLPYRPSAASRYIPLHFPVASLSVHPLPPRHSRTRTTWRR